MIDLSEEPVEENIGTTAAYLKRAAPMKQWLEMVSLFLLVVIINCMLISVGNRYHWW